MQFVRPSGDLLKQRSSLLIYMFTLKNFSKSYSGHLIIHIDELVLEPGVYWLKGENGSGKTTLFKSLAGLHPCSGEVRFADEITLHNSPVEYRRYVNYAEAEPLYPGFLTARDLFHFVGKAKRALPAQHQLIDRLGIKSYYENPCETYSSGMLKKLSLALAFLGAPRLIILDEPLITLDERARKTLFELIHEFTAGNKSIVLISSHQSIDESLLPVNQTFTINNKTLQSS